MILKLAYESQQEPEPAIEVAEPPELIGLRQWLAIDGIKGHWQHTIASAEYWRLEVDAIHKDIAFLLHQIIGGDPSESTIRDYLFSVHGLLPSNTVSLANLEKLLRKDAAQNRRVNSATPIENFISDTRFDLDELLKLGEQTTADGTIDLPLSAPRTDGATSTTVRLFAASKASSIYKAFLRRLREFDKKLSLTFETEYEGKLKTASGLAMAIRRLLLEIERSESQDRQSEKQVDSGMPSSVKLPLYDDDFHVGMVVLSELTKLCTSLLRQDKRQGTLYRDEAGRFIYHVWDYDDQKVGRKCQLVRPTDAYEIALKADQFNGDSRKLIESLGALKPDSDRRGNELIERNTPKQTAKERELEFDEAITVYTARDWARDETLNNKAWRVRSGKQTGELFGGDASERGWFKSRTEKRVIKKDDDGVWVYLTASHSKKLTEFFRGFDS